MTASAFLELTDPRRLPPRLAGAVVAIGNFDGVHRGHQFVLERALEIGARLARPVVAVTFEPHPRQLFRPDVPLFRLTPPAAKAKLMRAMGVDGLIVHPFDREFAAHTAEDFVADVLIAAMKASHVVVGFDFHFGRARAGSPDFLADAGRRHGFGVDIVPAFVAEDGEAVSSSRIRAALQAGDLAVANGLLGYRWFVNAEVVHGAKRGRELGMPTANMELPPATVPRQGVYAVRFRTGEETHMGVANFGRRPQFDNGAPLLETHLIDYSGDLYGQTCTVTFVGYLRPELKFSSVSALVEQMNADREEARALLTALPPGTVLDRALDGMG